MIKAIATDKAPAPAGHYAQATQFGELIFVSGQLPIDPKQKEKAPGTAEEQAHQMMANVAAVLEAAGSSMQKVIKTNIYISDISLWGKVNEVYAQHFGDHRPARAVIPCKELHYGYLMEMEVVAHT